MKLLSITKHRLSNGLAVFVAQSAEDAAFEILMHVEAGSRDEPRELNGICHFLEHMMFRGTQRFADSVTLAHAMEGLGGENNAMTTAENTVYWLRGSAARLESALPVFAEFFLRPTFPDLEIERSIVLQELANDYNEEGVLVESDTLGLSTMFAGHPLGLPIIGTEESIKSIGQAELHAFRAKHHTPQTCALGVLSPLASAAVLPWLEANFGTTQWAPAEGSNSLPIEGARYAAFMGRVPPASRARSANPISQKVPGFMRLQENPDNQFTLKVMFPCAAVSTETVIRQNFLERILNDGVASRLQSSIRERLGLVYDISCDANTYSDIGVFNFDATVSADGLRRLLTALAEELRRACDVPPSAEEMERVRFRYLFDLHSMYENHSRVLAREMSRHFLAESMSIDEEMSAVHRITADDVIAAARAIFLHPDRTVVLVGPKAKKQDEAVQRFFQTLSK